jgi:hypothetical protein
MTAIFTHEGERFQLHLYGPVTCLCYCLSDQTLWRFETQELLQLIQENISELA